MEYDTRMRMQAKRDAIYLVLVLLLVGYTIWYYSRIEDGEGRVIQFTILGLLLIGGFLWRVIKNR